LAKKIDFTPPVAALAPALAEAAALGAAEAAVLGAVVAAGLPDPDELPHAATQTTPAATTATVTNFRMNMTLLHVVVQLAKRQNLPSTR
jgi:hypothetical protein